MSLYIYNDNRNCRNSRKCFGPDVSSSSLIECVVSGTDIRDADALIRLSGWRLLHLTDNLWGCWSWIFVEAGCPIRHVTRALKDNTEISDCLWMQCASDDTHTHKVYHAFGDWYRRSWCCVQGWVFNAVPWLVPIPCQWFSGWLSDRLVGKGEYVIDA